MIRIAALATTVALLGVAPLHRAGVAEPRIVPPLADPALAPGIARCTSDGACTVTAEDGATRAGTPLRFER